MTPPHPTAAAGLTPADAERLAALVAAATGRQSKALDDAIDGGMGHIHRLHSAPHDPAARAG